MKKIWHSWLTFLLSTNFLQWAIGDKRNYKLTIMNKLLLLVLSVFSMTVSASAKDGFTTTFDISGMADTTQFVIRLHDSASGYGEMRFDTIQVVKGRGLLADISGVNYPTQAYAFTPYGDFSFYVSNNVNEKISGSVQDIENVSLRYEGAPWSEDFMIFNREIAAPMERLNRMQKNLPTMTKAEKDSMYAGYRNLSEKEERMYMEYPNSWVTLERMVYKLADMSRDDLKEIFAHLTADRKESSYGKTLENYLAVTPITEGAALADYEIEGMDQNGNAFRLSDVKEPYIVVDFSQCYCGPCIMAAKEIAQLREKYDGVVAFVNYSCDDTEKDWRKAVERDSITWPSVFDGSGPMGNTCLKYNVNGYPTFFVFGPDRTLVKTWDGYGKGLIERELSELIAKPTKTSE